MNKDKLLELAKQAIDAAYVPYVDFRVGVALVSKEGNFYSGCNIQNAALPVSICAETNAIAHMIRNGDKTIKELLVLSDHPPTYPCGSCRQQINEFSDENTIIHIASKDKILQTVTIKDLLPNSLDPKDLDNI